MAFSQSILLFTGIAFVILPHLNLGLLSDYKICGDSECESLMSRVQAIRDHRGKDCRFLSFRRGDTIFVYHKLTGKIDNLWAGTIDRQFGYFPRDAVQEEQVYATTEKIVETQKSDFICMDELGYPIDSSHLDNDHDGYNDLETQNQNSETTHTILHTDKTSTESSPASADLSSGSPVSAQQPDSKSAEEDEYRNAARTHEEPHETPAAVSKQGGSHSSSWLGSSVTGWLGMGNEEERGSLAEEEKKDERKETQTEASVTSSLTGWLGFGGHEKSGDATNNREEDKETAASLTSTMSGWLGFGDHKNTDSAQIKQDEKREIEYQTEPKVIFRSRRMSLDLEDSKLQVETEREVGTLDWLGNALSNTVGFGKTNEESETNKGEKEKPGSDSWLNFGVRDVLGYRKYGSEIEDSTGSDFRQTEIYTDSENVDISESHPSLTEDETAEPDKQSLEEEVKKEATPEVGDFSIISGFSKDTKESNVEQDQVPKSETEVDFATSAQKEDSKENNSDASDGSKDSNLPVDAAIMVDQTKLEETSVSVDIISSMIDEERDAVTGSEVHQMHKSRGNESVDNKGEQRKEDPSSVGSNSVVQSLIKIEEGIEDEEEGATNTNQADNTEGLTIVSTESSVNGKPADESKRKSQPFLSMGGIEPTHQEDDSVPAQSAETDAGNFNGNNKETLTHYDEVVQKTESQMSNRSTKSLYENVSENSDNTDYDTRPQQMEQGVIQRQNDIEHLEESETNIKNSSQQPHTEKELLEFEISVLNKVTQKSATKSETETEEVQELKQKADKIKKENQEEVEEFKEENHMEAEKVKEEQRQEEILQVREKEKQEGPDNIKKVEEKQTVELKEEEKLGKLEELNEEEKSSEGEKRALTNKYQEENKQAKVEDSKEQGEINKANGSKETAKEKGEERQVQLPHYTNSHDTAMSESKSNEKVEEDTSRKCLNEHCVHSTEDESVKDMNENFSEWGPSPADGVTIQRGKQNDQTLAGGSQTVPSQEVEINRTQEKPSKDAKADAGDKKNTASNASGNEAIGNDIFDPNSLEVEHIVTTNYTKNGQLLAGEIGHSGIPSEMLLDKMTEDEAPKPLSSPGASQESEPERTDPHLSQDPVGFSVPSGDYNKGRVENERAGAFGVVKKAFSFFSQTSVTETTEPTESALSVDRSTDETSEPQVSLTTEQRLDPTTDSRQVSVEDLHKDSLVTIRTQQLTQPFLQSTVTPSHLYTSPPNGETPIETKTLSKLYKNLLSHVSVDDITFLMEMFGEHKLQFLEYILSSSETVTEGPANDESILSDIERLLYHHRERLVTPNMRLADASQEDKEKTKMLIALQKLDMLLGGLREAFNTALASCVDASCSTHSKDEKELKKTQDSDVATKDTNIQRDEETEKRSGELDGVTGKVRKTEEGNIVQTGSEEGSESIQPGSLQQLGGIMKQILDFICQMIEESTTYAYSVKELLTQISVQVVSSLPDDIRPGPDLYGVPWEPVIISGLVGLVTMLLFTCRCYSSVKSRMYRSKERWMAEQVAQLLDEKCKVLETLSKCQQEYDDVEDSLRDSGVLAQSQKTEQLEIKARQLEQTKNELEKDFGHLKDQLEQQQERRLEQERRIAVLEESMNSIEKETQDLQSQEEQAQTTLKVYSMNADRLQKNLENTGEENTLLKESNAQLGQQAEGWAERVSELEAEIRRCEITYSGMQKDVANKDERIMSLTDRLLRMKAWDSELEEEQGEEEKKETSNGTAGKGEENETEYITDTQAHLQKVQKLIYAAKLNADLKSLDEDKDRVFAKLNNEVKAKEDLQESIKELENEKVSVQLDAEHYSDQVQRLQQKLQIMTEMYQENELKLHRLLTVEERERLQKEEKLTKADKNIALAIEEVNNYRQRAEEMEEELEKTKLSYQAQISAHEKKAHNNWLAARAAERDLADIRRENALLRQKLTDTQFKLDAIDKDPFALDSLARPLPFRAERSPYGPSPLGRPASETRPFLSPPTLMDGPPNRLSPRVPHGPLEPPGGQGELERSAGPHSDNGSISPTWERDRRGAPLPPPGPLGPPGPIGHPGYMLQEPVGPMYRRGPPPPGAISVMPRPGSLPPGPLLPHPRAFSTDMADGMYRDNLGPGEQEHRESGPGDRRTPPDADLRMGGPLPPGLSMGPTMDSPFPRRTHYGPPPPDFFPTRGPGGPPMRPMWAPAPPGMMFPPRFPPGGPPHPHYATHIRPPAPDGLQPPSMGPPAPQQSLPSPPHSQSPEEHTPSTEDNI